MLAEREQFEKALVSARRFLPIELAIIEVPRRRKGVGMGRRRRILRFELGKVLRDRCRVRLLSVKQDEQPQPLSFQVRCREVIEERFRGIRGALKMQEAAHSP